jgi:hypothetical protein
MNEDIRYALHILDVEISIKKYRLVKDHLLPQHEKVLHKEIEWLESAVKKINKI